MAEKVIQNAFIGRTDGYIDKGTDCSNPIQETWIHKQVIVKTGEGEDDWVIEEKAVLVDSINIDKEIQARAVGTDLKSLLKQVLRTGDDSCLHVHPEQKGLVDLTQYPTDSIQAHNAIIAGQAALDSLPQDLKDKGLDSVVNMTADEIKAYVDALVAEKLKAQEPSTAEIKEGEK